MIVIQWEKRTSNDQNDGRFMFLEGYILSDINGDLRLMSLTTMSNLVLFVFKRGNLLESHLKGNIHLEHKSHSHDLSQKQT